MSVFIIEHVFKSYTVGKVTSNVLNDVNITLPEKGLVSIIGKSGSGKSTLLNLLMGIEKPDKGKIYFNQKNINKLNDKQFSNYHLNDISIVFQHYNLFNYFSALDNVMLPLLMKGYSKAKAKAKAIELFKTFKLTNLIHQNVDKLSGGEKQRIGIMRSLITNPKAILCDEPTGALDEKNSIEIMDILKNISLKTLVVLVSHNQSLVEKYSDEILTLKDGRIVNYKSNISYKFSNKFPKSSKSYSGSWITKFIISEFKRNKFKNIFSIVASVFSFISVYLSAGFIYGSSRSQDEAINRNLSMCFSTASETEFIDLEGSPLSFQKSIRPSLELVDSVFGDISSIHAEDNLSYLISDYATCTYNNKIVTGFSMIPIYDFNNLSYFTNLVEIDRDINNSFSEIVVNNEFLSLINKKDLLNEEIVLSSSSEISFATNDKEKPFIKDTFTYTQKFKIIGIVNEFSFLNSPKIYYSYLGAKEFISNYQIENQSYYLDQRITYYDYLRNCRSDDSICSYSYFLFVDDPSNLNEFFKRVGELEKTNNLLQVSSNAYDIKQTYKTFIDSFSSTLVVFVIIAFIGVNFMLGMISLSTFIQNRKETAIMTCLGGRNKSIQNLYLIQNYIFIIIALLIAFTLSTPISNLINIFIEKQYELNNFLFIPLGNFLGIPFGLTIILLLTFLCFSTLFTLIPLSIYRHGMISEELRDE